MINTKKLNFKQMQLVNEIIALGAGEFIYTAKELNEMHQKLRNRKYSPYFIDKNTAAKLSQKRSAEYDTKSDLFDLEVFTKFAAKFPPVEVVKKSTPKKTKKVAPKKTTKRVAKPKSTPTPDVPVEPVVETVPVTTEENMISSELISA